MDKAFKHVGSLIRRSGKNRGASRILGTGLRDGGFHKSFGTGLTADAIHFPGFPVTDDDGAIFGEKDAADGVFNQPGGPLDAMCMFL